MIESHLPKLIKKYRNALSPSVLTRGKMIFDDHRDDIKVIKQSKNKIIAHVQGREPKPYNLSITLDTSKKIAKCSPKCSCPFFHTFQGIDGCKHLYALTLYLEDLWGIPETGTCTTPVQAHSSEAEFILSNFASETDGRLCFIVSPTHSDFPDPIRISVVDKSDKDPTEFTEMSLQDLREETWSIDDQTWVDRILALFKYAPICYKNEPLEFEMTETWTSVFLPELILQKRLWVRTDEKMRPVSSKWDKPTNIQFSASIEEDEVRLHVNALYDGQKLPLPSKVPLFEGGLFFLKETLYRIAPPESVEIFEQRREIEKDRIPFKDRKVMLLGLYNLPKAIQIELPPELQIPTEKRPFTPELNVYFDEKFKRKHIAVLDWCYGNVSIPASLENDPFLDEESLTLIKRDFVAEQKAFEELAEIEDIDFIVNEYGSQGYPENYISIPKSLLFKFAEELLSRGWSIKFDDQKLTNFDHVRFEVAATEIDWFDVHAAVDYGDQTVKLPELLKAIRKGQTYINLENGSFGIVPKNIFSSLHLLSALGEHDAKASTIRFKGAQAVLLDVLVDQLPEISWQQESSSLRERIHQLKTPSLRKVPRSFKGKLRPYQEEGLGWLTYIQELGIQGCLADDMGLGKTVQVLALLEIRRLAKAGPSLLVMPKSLVHNWLHEAEKFTPKLKMVALTGNARPKSRKELPKAQVYITTYPLVQRDIHWLKEMTFDYAILDESQAIKNAKTKSAKSCRLLQATHRLTMTGTPVENRLDDLWSQLDFLNPGLFQAVSGKKHGVNDEEMDMLAKAVRPFLLRRTKEEVAHDLPEKVEETLYCEMTSPQAAAYQELKMYYQKQLTQTVNQKGLNNSKIMVLEALLRLRQAACHPGLIDAKKANQPCGKLEVLMEMLSEIVPTGHKALIFSQFTSFLALTKTVLDKEGYRYAYLDGKTKDRAEQIEHFQNSKDCNLFLISLKAGGVGLNLTAADYVFLLDPWWNPAIEAQAIDRAHRIGQHRNVFAYRIVAENTIEDKILQLQAQKKQLADAILKGKNSLISGLTMEDLNFLLG